jgi:hypothetical protein
MGVAAVLFGLMVLAAEPPQSGAAPAEQGSQQAPANGSAPAEPAQPDGELPVSLDKIQRALARRPAIKVQQATRNDRNDLPTFRIDVEGQKLTIEQILGPDFLRGPVPYGGMTHQEFLSMVTPKDVQGYAPFTNTEAATVAITSFALQWALKTAIREFQEAKDERAKEAARKEVQEALEALRKARREAGLPDK